MGPQAKSIVGPINRNGIKNTPTAGWFSADYGLVYSKLTFESCLKVMKALQSVCDITNRVGMSSRSVHYIMSQPFLLFICTD